MVREKFHIPAFPLLRTAVSLTALVLAVAGAAVIALSKMGHGQMIPLILSTAGICLAAALVSLTPVWMVGRATADALPGAFMVSILLRLTLTLGGAVLLSDIGFDRQALAVAIVGWYVLLLVAEVAVFVRFAAGVRPRDPNKEVSAC